MEDSQVPLNGDGNGHEDTAGEENVVEGIEKVGEKVMVYLDGQPTDGGGIGDTRFKSPSNTFRDTNNKEEEVKHCKSDEKAVKVALETLLT